MKVYKWWTAPNFYGHWINSNKWKSLLEKIQFLRMQVEPFSISSYNYLRVCFLVRSDNYLTLIVYLWNFLISLLSWKTQLNCVWKEVHFLTSIAFNTPSWPETSTYTMVSVFLAIYVVSSFLMQVTHTLSKNLSIHVKISFRVWSNWWPVASQCFGE